MIGKWKLRGALIFGILALHIHFLSAQEVKKYELIFHPVFGNTPLLLNTACYKQDSGDSMRMEALRFYISGIELLNNGKTVWKEENSFHLIDAVDGRHLLVSLNIPANLSFNRVKFNVGVDSLTNVSGALGGDLDPTKGMYWAWQSGYINIKVEGKSNICKTRGNAFQFHLGGYLSDFNALQTVVLALNGNDKGDIVVDLQQFFNNIDLANKNEIMSPGKDAVLLSGKFSKIFSTPQP